MTTVKTERGRKYDLSDEAILRLLDAKTADVAEQVFNEFASHVRRCDRSDVWFAVDNI